MRLRNICLSILVGVGAAHADPAGEREHLARLAHEIDALKALTTAAEAQSGYPQRIRFQYAWLNQDLDRVRHGILEHLNAPQGEPRRIAPLAGDYRR